VSGCCTTKDLVTRDPGAGFDVRSVTNGDGVELNSGAEVLRQRSDEIGIVFAVGSKAVVDVHQGAVLTGCCGEDCHGR
jgi:serine acetyltransferase